MGGQRKGGLIQLQVDGVVYDAKGDFTYNAGRPKRETIVGADRVHGFKETPQAAHIEGAITDSVDLDLDTLTRLRDVTVTLTTANGKVFVLRNAFYSADGDVTTGEGEIQVRFEGEGEEVA